MANQRLGNYQILEELGRGGMAIVYRAYQPSLNRYVAIKVLPPQLTFDSEFVERFQREARAAAGLRHPNIVVVHDVAQEGTTHYIVMEYLEGQTLGDMIAREGALRPERAARIAEQVAAALDYAHQRGFVHRDVKPNNIFVGEGDRVTLTDFGIAKAASEAQQLTRTGAIMGTPEYMSPEQAEGEHLDHRTDLYALGVVLYQMLVGRVPFRGTTPHAVLHDVIYEAPPPPRRLNPAITPAVEAVVMKAIAKRPEDRFQRGAHLTRALREALAQGAAPVRVGPAPSAAARGAGGPPLAPAAAAPAGSRLPWILGAAAVILFLIIGGLLLAIAAGRDDDTPTPAATFTLAVAQVTDTAPAAATPEGGGVTPSPLPTDAQATATLPPDTAAPPTDTPPPSALPPTDTATPTAQPPTNTATPTPVPPTDTPTATPTRPCPVAVAGELSGAWDRDRLGCPTASSSITWAAWEPFQRGAMIWRMDADTVHVLSQTASGPPRGTWREILDDWDGSEASVGPPPPGLYEPQRGFGWVWRTFLGGPTGQLGWATDEEKGFCAQVQPFERGFLLRSNANVEYCEDQLFNQARDPSLFPPLFIAIYDDGTWRQY